MEKDFIKSSLPNTTYYSISSESEHQPNTQVPIDLHQQETTTKH